jgi:hypothetical protein
VRNTNNEAFCYVTFSSRLLPASSYGRSAYLRQQRCNFVTTINKIHVTENRQVFNLLDSYPLLKHLVCHSTRFNVQVFTLLRIVNECFMHLAKIEITGTKAFCIADGDVILEQDDGRL